MIFNFSNRTDIEYVASTRIKNLALLDPEKILGNLFL